MGDTRKMADCRMFPSDSGCTLTISGSEDEVMRVAVRHAVEEHGHQDTPELRDQLRSMLVDERAAALTS
jgi:predicted small metal-binding protein